VHFAALDIERRRRTAGVTLNPVQKEGLALAHSAFGIRLELRCEMLVIATGFESSVPGVDLAGERFPRMTDWYAAVDNPNVHYMGWLMHEKDFKKGAGGFLSGYRYLVRNLYLKIVREVDFGVPYPYEVFTTKDEVYHKVQARIQTASDLIILQDGVVVRDVIVPVKKANSNVVERYEYYEGATYQFHEEWRDRDDVIFVFFVWGGKIGRTPNAVFDSHHYYQNSMDVTNIFLHPAIRIGYNATVQKHILEDIAMEWSSPATGSNERLIEAAVMEALDGNLTLFYPVENFVYEPTVPKESDPGFHPRNYERTHVRGFPMNLPLYKGMIAALASNYSEESLAEVRKHAAEAHPRIFESCGERC